jgi:hypothetical protein
MTKERIGLVLGVPTLLELFDEKYYTQLSGGILESFGRLFKNDLKLFVYPMQDQLTGCLTTVETARVAPELQKLYSYLHNRGSFVALDNYNPDYPQILSRDVMKRIADRDPAWEKMVPEAVCDLVKKRGFFGYAKGARG